MQDQILMLSDMIMMKVKPMQLQIVKKTAKFTRAIYAQGLLKLQLDCLRAAEATTGSETTAEFYQLRQLGLTVGY